LAEDWRNANNADYGTPVPIEAYEPIIGWLVDQATECGWNTKDELLGKLDMHIGMGYSDEQIENKIRKDLNSGT
jgi:hypothetical protein